jgi:phosphoribosylamine--glycine ligase
MNILVIGSGGREHAIIKAIKQNLSVDTIYALPGNGGISADAECFPIGAEDIAGITDFAKSHDIDFAVVAPDGALVVGAADVLRGLGIPCFGPSKAAAIIEGSKIFSKDFMKKYNIPTAGYEVFSDAEKALSYLETSAYPIVIKADGLALGKGVIIAEDKTQAMDAVKSVMTDKKFGESGNSIVIEEFLTGPEVSVLCFTDGDAIKPMVSSMDHKRAFDGDKGLNTGGMGVVAPNPHYTDAIADECMETIFLPTIKGMDIEGRKFSGCLYFGLMLTSNGPKVIEYNCRFGDPETQAVLPLMQSDLLTVMQACENGTLAQTEVKFSDMASACVILASGGYPESYQTGFEISVGDVADSIIYHAGTKIQDGKLVTSGGRVLAVTAVADSLEGALDKAYSSVNDISFTGMFYRKDIGQKALEN